MYTMKKTNKKQNRYSGIKITNLFNKIKIRGFSLYTFLS